MAITTAQQERVVLEICRRAGLHFDVPVSVNLAQAIDVNISERLRRSDKATPVRMRRKGQKIIGYVRGVGGLPIYDGEDATRDWEIVPV